jgi:hypothetical protein
MKKIIFALVAVVLAACSQAATVSWTLALGKTPYGGYDAYAFVGNSDAASAMATALTTTGISALTGYAWSGKLTTTRGTATVNIENVEDSSSVYFVLLSATEAGADVYVTDAMSVAGYTYASGATPPATLPKSDAAAFTLAGTVATGSSTPEVPPAGDGNVPEPTSGLLMLIGAAGLALRRKNA